MGIAKVISLKARPLQASHLCFEVNGILGELDTQLGTPVIPFDFDHFYGILGPTATAPGDPSRLFYDWSQIQQYVKPSTLAALRAEARKIAVTKAIDARQNAYYAKYGQAPAIISIMNQYYSPSSPGSKPNRLANLSTLANAQAGDLKAAYITDGRTGVVRTTGSVLNSTIESGGNSIQTGESDDDSVATITAPGRLQAPPPGGRWTGITIGGRADVDYRMSASSESATSTGSATESQTIVNTDYGYREPILECQAQNERAQISLMDEQFAQFVSTLNMPNLTRVFENELHDIDGDVYRLQIDYLNTVLLSPIPGIVTGIYKNPGDAIRAGEPVIRVENNDTVLLVATLIYRGSIPLHSTMKVQTSLFDSSSSPSMTGEVVAVRGHRDEDDQWDVVVSCNNIGGGGLPILPLNYHFDYDDTTVSIT